MSTDPKFACEYAKRGTAACKKCKSKCDKGELRIAKVVPNFFHDGEGMLNTLCGVYTSFNCALNLVT